MKRGYKFIFAGLILAIFLLTTINAATIKIKTLENRTVYARAVTPENYGYIDSTQKMSDASGNVEISLNTGVKFNLFVQVKENGRVLLDKKYIDEEYSPSAIVELEIYPDWMIEQQEVRDEMNARAGISNTTSNSTETSNETLENSTEQISNETFESLGVEDMLEENLSVTSEDIDKKSWLTGLATSVEENLKTTNTPYYIGGILLVAIIGYFVLMIFKRKGKKEEMEYYPKPKQSEDIRVRKLSEIQKRANEDRNEEKELAEAQRRLRETQREINELKNKDRIDSIKKEIVEKEKELLRLRSGNNNANPHRNYNSFGNNNQDRQ